MLLPEVRCSSSRCGATTRRRIAFAELVSVIGRYGRFDAEEVFSLLTVVSDGAGAELAGTVLRNDAKPYVEPRQRVESPFDR